MSVSARHVGELIEAVASDEPVPGGGAVSGIAAALAAGLAAMAARYALRHDPDSALFTHLTDRADALRARAVALADADADAYGRYVAATRLPRDPDPGQRRAAIRAALDAAADVPADLGGLAADVAVIGEKLAVAGNTNLRSDACAASLLASAVAGSAAILVEENLRGRVGDTRITTARAHAAAAAACARRAVAVGSDSTASDSKADSCTRSSR
jgi:formiminotetrahydrofolate cyclodeaminase